MVYQIGIEVVDVGERQLHHDVFPRFQLGELFRNVRPQEHLRLTLLGAVDVDLSLDDGYQVGGHDLLRDLELLVDDRLDADMVGSLYE